MAHDVKFMHGEIDEDNWKSRSQKKRESTALQKMGEDLINLAPSVLRTLELPEELLNAIIDCQKISSHEARRRQLQYIGRLMREEADEEQTSKLATRIEQLKSGQDAESEKLHRAEATRAALLADTEKERNAAFKDALVQYPGIEAARLESLMKMAVQEKEKVGGKKNPKAFRELYRYLRERI